MQRKLSNLSFPFMLLIGTFLVTAAATMAYIYFSSLHNKYTIRVGILHSQTGTMAISELPVIDATILAIDEINQAGGLLGKLIEPVVADGASDWPTFAAQAEKLISQDHVDVIFGCWTSASRKSVKPIVEKYDHLLFYPVSYEGLESSPNIIYTGAAPNQQILPGVTWAYYNLGTSFFLVGSDYIYPRVANALIKAHLPLFGGKIVGEAYQPLNNPTFQKIAQDIVAAKPEVIINTINGSGNIAFFKELRNAGITPDKISTISFSIQEEELRSLPTTKLAGDYGVCSYFQSINQPENLRFIEQFKKKYGQDRVTDEPLEAAYFGVHMWAETARKAKTTDVNTIREAIKGQGMHAPEGIVSIEFDNNHTWKMVRIGKITPEGQFAETWTSHKAIRPVTFPTVGNQNWSGLLERLYTGWNNQWSAE